MDRDPNPEAVCVPFRATSVRMPNSATGLPATTRRCTVRVKRPPTAPRSRRSAPRAATPAPGSWRAKLLRPERAWLPASTTSPVPVSRSAPAATTSPGRRLPKSSVTVAARPAVSAPARPAQGSGADPCPTQACSPPRCVTPARTHTTPSGAWSTSAGARCCPSTAPP
jgi:hypothetical protein